ncbi:MAG: CHC2 zinc finger domain-containing protein [Actinomycetota bacterium]|nr:CHC2 zinc finger domain-containing protein [Actinomycetota bacterium]
MAPSRFEEADVQRVREASRLDLVIARYFRLRPAGNDQFNASCPFHLDQFASLNIAPTVRGGRYHCFGCGADGDVFDFDFVMKIDRLSYAQAVRHLATQAGIELSPPTNPET